ncbi:hypothetical protein SAOR_01005 [Salinisphaera orenii MK-B5]|uniref:Uncharacterized protein n=1 Tax=Salinisphaera orenii MK-B5 TaxID=856730 RepID=A0A423PYC6_9GAMM|nr:hypothetical protein [Salinisphaera orenii]ROO30601.1 hypothetical protein SAOR_01005 [Salinisphaera orenii MK-B5]
MSTRTFYMVAEIRLTDDGSVQPKRSVSGPYQEYLLAKQVSVELGDQYHVFEVTDVEALREKAAEDES